ncbi:hypothetical protein MMC27_006760 [Xylographa pallens]|nr:hypothetical protein [Xylographa pallens]
MSSSSSSGPGRGLAHGRPGLSQSSSSGDSHPYENAAVDINEDGIDRVGQRSTESDTTFTDSAESSSSDETTPDQSSHDRPRRLRPPPPEGIQHAVVAYVTMYLADQDEIIEWVASGDSTRIPFFPRLDQPGTPEYDASSDARVWALDVLELMAWQGRAHLPQPAAFFASYDELRCHAGRWQFQFPYTQAIVNGDETPTPIRSGELHPELGSPPRMTSTIETVESNDTDLESLLHGHDPHDLPPPIEYRPTQNLGQFGPQRMLDMYNNIIENPDEYWNNDERILTFDEPPAPPPYGPHQQDELGPVHERPLRPAHPDLLSATTGRNDWQPPHGSPPSYRNSGSRHPHRHARPPPTTEPRLNLLGAPITPRDSPPHAPSPRGPEPWDPIPYWEEDLVAALHAAFGTTPPPQESTIRNRVPSPDASPTLTRAMIPHMPPRSMDPPAAAALPPATPSSTAGGTPGRARALLATPPSRAPSTAPSTPPPTPATPPSTPLLLPSHTLLPSSLPPFSLPPPLIPFPFPSYPLPLSLSLAPGLLPLPFSPPLVPLPPSSPVLLPPPIPPRNPNRSGLFGMVPRFPRLVPAAEPAEPPPAYVSREDVPLGLGRGVERLGREGEEGERGEGVMRWPDVGEGRMRAWGRGRFVRGSGSGSGRVLRRRG